MKKLLTIYVLTALILGISSTLHSATKFGIKAGMISASVNGAQSNNYSSEGADAKLIGTSAGAQIEYDLNSLCSLSAELVYSQKGYLKNMPGTAIADSEKPKRGALTTGSRSQTTLQYLEIPILFKINPNPHFFIGAGPFVAILSGASLYTNDSGAISEQDIKASVNTLDYGVQGGVGYKSDSFFAEARWGQSLRPVLKSSADIKNTTVSFSAGFLI